MKKKVVFLDRDGVLNRDFLPYQYKLEDIFINPGVIETLVELKKRGYEFIIITNQGGIAKGIYGHEDVNRVNDFICNEIGKAGVEISEVYYCPHHETISVCICRKPDSNMLERAIARFNVDKEKSFFVGDTPRDVDAALKAGVTPVKVHSNHNLQKILEVIP